MLSKAEHREMLRLSAKCLDPKDWETPLPDADKKELKRLGELLAKLSPEPEMSHTTPTKIKGYVHSDQAKRLISEGAEFQGVEMRNHGTENKPRPVMREWFYVGVKGSLDPATARKAVFVQEGKVIEAGRTIAESAYARLAK